MIDKLSSNMFLIKNKFFPYEKSVLRDKSIFFGCFLQLEGEKENHEEQTDKPAVSKDEVGKTDVTEETSNNIANEAIDEALSSENVS